MHFICARYGANGNIETEIIDIRGKKSVKNNLINLFPIPHKKIKRKGFLLITRKIWISEKKTLVIIFLI